MFVSAADAEATERLASLFATLSVTHARFDLGVRADFQATLAENAAEFGYKGSQLTQVYVAGVNLGTAAEVCALHESDPTGLAQRIPEGCIKQSLE